MTASTVGDDEAGDGGSGIVGSCLFMACLSPVFLLCGGLRITPQQRIS
jgi:hypothetical protein